MHRLIRRAALTLAVLAGCGALTESASAYTLTYWNSTLTSFDSKSGPRHTLVSNFGQVLAGSSYVVGVYALEENGTPAGSIAWGNGTTSHTYCACAVRYPVLASGEAGTYYFTGIETY
jgi:hypothetical protein